MKKTVVLFLLCVVLGSLVAAQEANQGNETAQEEPDFISCRSCKTVQAFTVEFGIYFGIIMIIHVWRWILAGDDLGRKSVIKGYIVQTAMIIGTVFLIIYLISWVAGFFGFVVWSPHATMEGCKQACVV